MLWFSKPKIMPKQLSRRTFIKQASAYAAAVEIAGTALLGSAQSKKPGNALPRWRGFNLIDFNSPDPSRGRRGATDEDLKWMVDWGFDFVRLPMAYPRYVIFDRSKPITPEEVCKINEEEVDRIEAFVRKAQAQGLHVCLNLHRAPGYCINAGFNEPYNLWQSKAAREAFCFHWSMWARRFKNDPPEKISFDLLNEPSMRVDMNDQHGSKDALPGGLYRAVAKQAVEAIRAVNPGHLVIADGNRGGSLAVPELKVLNIAQSCRGYYPGQISHYKAPWANKDPERCPTPVWPGAINGEHFGKDRLQAFYQPWIELLESGVGVHCGECGCWKKTPHAVFLAWFTDVLDILTEHQIGYALWNFRGDFGILDSGREDVEYQDWHGHKLDGKLLELLKRH
jgi:aryl-phospho-beta-D-glucosidase BglC (GH1 family)